MTERERLPLLCRFPDSTEVRAWFDTEGNLVVWWFEPDGRGKGNFIADCGAKVPRAGLAKLTEILMEKL